MKGSLVIGRRRTAVIVGGLCQGGFWLRRAPGEKNKMPGSTVRENDPVRGAPTALPGTIPAFLWYNLVSAKHTTEAGDLNIKPLYDKNSVCPHCGGVFALRLLKKGFRLKCTNCRFFIYPPAGQIDEKLTKACLSQISEKIKEIEVALPKRFHRQKKDPTERDRP